MHVKGLFRTQQLTTIELQIIRFRSELDRAIETGGKEITFIHGVGSGRLKEEIRKVVSESYPAVLVRMLHSAGMVLTEEPPCLISKRNQMAYQSRNPGSRRFS